MLIERINSWQDLAAIPKQFALEKNHWIFRGVEWEQHELIPKIGRRGTRRDYEGRPVDYSPEAEQAALLRFQREARPHISIAPESDLEWLSIAQHHGLPTRLLDWTESPLIAAYFALEKGGFILKDGKTKIVNPAIYGFEPEYIIHRAKDYDDWLNKSPHKVAAYYPGHVTPRITAQRGLFTCHKSPNHPYAPKTLIKWVIQNDDKSITCMQIKMFLNKCGLNDASMFPGLDGIAKHVE
jgi:FRG domain